MTSEDSNRMSASVTEWQQQQHNDNISIGSRMTSALCGDRNSKDKQKQTIGGGHSARERSKRYVVVTVHNKNKLTCGLTAK